MKPTDIYITEIESGIPLYASKEGVRGQWCKTAILVETPEGTKTAVVVSFVPMDQDESLLALGNCLGNFVSDERPAFLGFKNLVGIEEVKP